MCVRGIFNAIPMTLKSAVSVGIGLFVAFVGLQNAKLIVNSDSTLVTYQHFKGETFHSVGVGAILALIGVAITAILLVKKVKGGILYGILITWVLGILCEVTGIYVPNADAGMYSVIPTAFVSFDFSALGKTFGQVFKTDFSGVGILNFFAVMFSFLFVDLFDTLGTLIGVASKADMLDEDGKLPRIKGALMADSIATCAGAVLGTSTTTTFVESASGVTEGGRTGLTSMTTGVLFLLATIFSPLFLTIPSFATAPALIIVGFYMMGSAVKIDFNDPSEGIPAFLTILAMPTAYSISEGHCHWCNLLDHHQCGHWQGQGKEDQPADVCADRAVHPEVHLPVRFHTNTKQKLLPSRKGRAAALSVEIIGADGGGCAPREWPRCRNGWGPRREDAPRWHERCLLRGGVPCRYGPPAEPPFPPNETCPACSRSFVGTTSSGGVSAT